MAKIKVKRKMAPEIPNSVPEVIEIDEADVLETDERVPDQPPVTTKGEKTLTQSEVNKLMADQRREHESKYKALVTEFDALKKSIEDKDKAANEAAARQHQELRSVPPQPTCELPDTHP